MNDDMWLDVPRKRIYVTGTDTTTVFAQRDRPESPIELSTTKRRIFARRSRACLTRGAQ